MRVAVLGAGYAGLTLARRLDGSLPDEASLVVVDESDRHLLQHELHRAIRRPSLADEIAIPFEDVLDCEVRRARVTDVDPEAGVATLAPVEGDDESDAAGKVGESDPTAEPLDYDEVETTETLDYGVGAVCLGAETAFHGIPGVEANATPLKRLAHARQIRADYEGVLEADGKVVIGGAGLSGVQVAGELAAMAREAGVDPEVVVLERLDSVAPGFDPTFQDAVREQLESRGVDVRTDSAVASADADRIELADGSAVGYDQFVWTGGIRGPEALEGDRPTVRSDLRLAGDTFVVGDAARVVDAEGEGVPASAQAAVRQARVAARNVRDLVAHRLAGDGGFEPRLDRYTFDSPGWLVSVGDGAVAQVGSRVLTGRAALALKTSVGAGYLGSVGAVENAVDLVREELSLAGEDPAGSGDESTGSDRDPPESVDVESPDESDGRSDDDSAPGRD